MIETLEQGKHGSFAETPSKKRTESPPDIRSPKEEILATREKTLSKKIGRGVTDSSFVELKRDKLFPKDGIRFLENLKHAFRSGYLVATDIQE